MRAARFHTEATRDRGRNRSLGWHAGAGAPAIGLRRSSPERPGQRGTTFVELMGAMTVISLAMLVMLQQLTISYRETNIQHDRLWAQERAAALLAEVQSRIERGEIKDVEDLEELADSTVNPVLTTMEEQPGVPFTPEHPMSGNWQRSGRWLWGRRLTVTSPDAQERIRNVRVQIYKTRDDGEQAAITTLAQSVTLPRRSYPSTKVYDLYALAIAEVPSLLGPLPTVRAELENALQQIRARAAGLSFRVHWITRLGYGRDPLYTPFVNTVDSSDVATPGVYWYPGLVAGGGSTFSPAYFTGRYRDENGVVNEFDAATLPVPHAIADQFNHCLRLSDALELHQARSAVGLEADELPLQLLLHDILTAPDKYRNALFINLHGDGIPMPPLRNYADAAREPMGHPGVRVVTHPARLQTPRDPNGDGDHADSQDLELRIYAYKTDPSAGAAVLTTPITVQIMGVDLSQDVNGGASSTLSVRRLVGGVDTADGSLDASEGYAGFDEAAGAPPSSDPGNFEMWYEAGYVSGPQAYTWIRLHNTPLVAPQSGNRGLSAAKRLYGYEYVPGPVGSGGAFAQDLALEDAVARPRNTARWRLRVPKRVFQAGFLGGGLANADLELRVVTRIGTDLTTGTVWPTTNQPANVSRTSAWWTASRTAVPLLERYQILGDPRHNPYADLCDTGAFPDGYNWCFTADASDWPSLDGAKVRNGYGGGVVADVPRVLQIWREAMQGAGAIWINFGGSLAHKLFIGGEIGAPPEVPAAPPQPVTVTGELFGLSGAVNTESVSNGAVGGVSPPVGGLTTLIGEHLVMGNLGTGYWAKPWLGELVDDAHYATWFAVGNLPVGIGTNLYHRAVRVAAAPAQLPSGTTFDFPAGATIGVDGGSTFVQSGDAAATFAHSFDPTAVAKLTESGAEVPTAVGLVPRAALNAATPFALDAPGSSDLAHVGFPGRYPPTVLTALESLAVTGGGATAAAVLSVGATASSNLVRLMVAGLTPANADERNVATAQVVLAGLRAFHRAGVPGTPVRVVQLPRLSIVAPSIGYVFQSPAAMQVRWSVDFRRFDGELPTKSYPDPFTEDESALRYRVIYTGDGGESWRAASSHLPVSPGVRPTNPAELIADSGVGNESYTFSTPASSMPDGEYLIRVEAYHESRLAHYGQHQVYVKIRR